MKRYLNSPLLLAPLAIALICTAAADAQDTKKEEAVAAQSPTGEWAWERKSGTDSVLCRLSINEKDGKLTGKYKDNRRELKIQNAKMENGWLSFEINPKPDDKSRLIAFKGKVADDAIVGTMTYTAGESTVSPDWKAKRYDPASAVLGKWSVDFETPDGQALNFQFEIKKKGKGIGLAFLGDNDSKVSKVEFKNGVLVFDSKQEYEGQPISVEWDLDIDGDNIGGKLFYSFSEGEGELDVTGNRIK